MRIYWSLEIITKKKMPCYAENVAIYVKNIWLEVDRKWTGNIKNTEIYPMRHKFSCENLIF